MCKQLLDPVLIAPSPPLPPSRPPCPSRATPQVGGLGDVVTALGRAVQDQGHVVEVILPRYEFFMQSPMLRESIKFECEFDWGGTRIVVSTCMVENLRVFFIEPRNGFFATQAVYGRWARVQEDGLRRGLAGCAHSDAHTGHPSIPAFAERGQTPPVCIVFSSACPVVPLPLLGLSCPWQWQWQALCGCAGGRCCAPPMPIRVSLLHASPPHRS